MSTQKPSEPARSAELVRVCSVEGCDRQPRSGKAEMCHTHYEQVRTHGHLTEPKPIVRRLEIDLAQQVRCPMGLTVQEVREYLAMDCCPICGEGPWKALSAHLRKHGVKAREVKMWAGLNRTVSLISSSFREEKSAQCKADGWKPPPRLKGNRWGAMSQGLEAQGTPHVELTNVNHGDWGAYRKGCRCDRCRLANSERQHEMRKRRLTRLDRAADCVRGIVCPRCKRLTPWRRWHRCLPPPCPCICHRTNPEPAMCCDGGDHDR